MGIKILLADDSVTAQNMGKKILSEAGHEVVTVSNGAAAAKKIAEIKPDLVLLDVFMPGYSGLELCERLRSAPGTFALPVLLTVGRMEPYSPQDGARVKADGVIIKPFEASDLIAAVERLAEKSQQEASSPASVKQAVPEAPAPAQAKSDGYEQTMRLDQAQIAAMLTRSVPGPAPAAVPTTSPAEEFHVAPPPAEVAPADTSLPAFGEELAPAPVSESKPSAVPSYMSQYLAEQPAFSVEPEPASSPFTSFENPAESPEIRAFTISPPAASATAMHVEVDDAAAMPLSKDLLQQFGSSAAEAPVATAHGLELTASAPVVDVPIAQEIGLEPTQQSADPATVVLQDPALVTDPHRATMDFLTQFGTAEAPAQELNVATEATAAADDFEARLQAAMSSYEEPSPSILPQPEAATIDPEFELPRLVQPSAEIELEQEFSYPASANISVPEMLQPASDVQLHSDFVHETPAGLPVSQIASPEPSDVPFRAEPVEFAPMEVAPVIEQAEASSDLVGVEPAIDSPAAVEEVVPSPLMGSDPEEPSVVGVPDTDDAVIEQMRAAISTLPVDASHATEEHASPMAMAAAAGVSPISAPLGRETELEITRAVAAAMSAASPAHTEEAKGVETSAPPSAQDANSVASAVEKVMQRELPSLIWKIMAELDLKKRS